MATASTAIVSTKKLQQYNNYQKQQQFNMSSSKSIKSQVATNSGNESTAATAASMPSETSNKTGSSHYYKRHQPSQPTISSFMTNLDKSLFCNDKSTNGNAQPNQVATTTASEESSDTNTNSNENSDNLVDLSKLKVHTNPNAYNPKEFNISPKAARFFVIKSYSEDDVHRSIKYNIWCSTEHGNRRLDSAYFKGDNQVPVYLFFSVNGSGHFCGMAEMMSRVDYNKKTDVWSQDKWRGCFQVKWVYVKDVPNSLLRNIKLENNDNKPVTNSRDTQEIPFDKGKQVLKVFHTYSHTSSILDDFDHYERKQEEDTYKNLSHMNHNPSFNPIYHIDYHNHPYIIDHNSSLVAMGSNLILANTNSNLDRQILVDNNTPISNTASSSDANNENTSLVNSSSSTMTASTASNTATNTTVSSSTTSSPMSASSSSSSSSTSSVSSSDESKEVEMNKKDQQHQPTQLVVS